MTEAYLRAFVLGSSWLVFMPFFVRVGETARNYSYQTYTLLAPLYFGLMTMLAFYIRRHVGFLWAYLLISVLSPLIVFMIAYLTKAYPFTTTREWTLYAVRVFLLHLVTFMLVISPLDWLLSW